MYLRWDTGDADSIAPSLYKGRIKRGAGKARQHKQKAAEADRPELENATHRLP